MTKYLVQKANLEYNDCGYDLRDPSEPLGLFKTLKDAEVFARAKFKEILLGYDDGFRPDYVGFAYSFYEDRGVYPWETKLSDEELEDLYTWSRGDIVKIFEVEEHE